MSRPLVLVVGMLSTKDCESFLRNFAGLARRIVAVPIPRQEKSFPAARDRRRRAHRRHSGAGRRGPVGARALIGRFELEAPPRILITGSLYLAGAVLDANGTPPV